MKDFFKGLCGGLCVVCFAGVLGVVGACECGNITEAQCLTAGLCLSAGMAILYAAASVLSGIKK